MIILHIALKQLGKKIFHLRTIGTYNLEIKRIGILDTF